MPRDRPPEAVRLEDIPWQEESRPRCAPIARREGVASPWGRFTIHCDSISSSFVRCSKATLFVAKLQPTGEVAWARASARTDKEDSVVGGENNLNEDTAGRFLAIDPSTSAIWLAGTRVSRSGASGWFISKLAP